MDVRRRARAHLGHAVLSEVLLRHRDRRGCADGVVSLLPFDLARSLYHSNVIGASGAIYGLLLAYGLYFPDRPIYMYLVFPIPAKIFRDDHGRACVLLVARVSNGIANATHLGGLLVGYLYLKSARIHPLDEAEVPRTCDGRSTAIRKKFDVYSRRPGERLGPARSLTRPRYGCSSSSTSVEPVPADGTEQVELEGIFERFGLMLDPGRDVQHLAFPHGDFLAADEKLQCALQHVGHLLAFVRVHRHKTAAFDVDLRQHLALAGDDLPRQHLGHFLSAISSHRCSRTPSELMAAEDIPIRAGCYNSRVDEGHRRER